MKVRTDIVVATAALFIIGGVCWWSGYTTGIQQERRAAFYSGAARYECKNGQTRFIYGPSDGGKNAKTP